MYEEGQRGGELHRRNFMQLLKIFVSYDKKGSPILYSFWRVESREYELV